MLGWLSLLVGAALAMEPGAENRLAEGTFEALTAARVGGRTLIAATGPAGTLLLRDGASTRLEIAGTSVLLVGQTLYLCGESGLSSLDTEPLLLASPIPLSDERCEGLQPTRQGVLAFLAGGPVQVRDGALVPVDGTPTVPEPVRSVTLSEPCPHTVRLDGEGLLERACVASAPERLVLGSTWTRLEVTPGEHVSLLLEDGVGEADRFYAHGGPPGLEVSEVGRLRYTPTVAQAGIWRTTLQLREDGISRWTGLVVEVADLREDAGEGPVIGRATAARQGRPGPWEVRECFVEAGAHGGLSMNRNTEWAAVGLPDVVPSASPFVGATCAGGIDSIGWYAGVDSAPAYFHLGRRERGVHLVGGTAGVQTTRGVLRFGVHVNGGLAFFGVGSRLLLVPFETAGGSAHGLFLRATYYPAGPAGALTLGYAWEFGQP